MIIPERQHREPRILPRVVMGIMSPYLTREGQKKSLTSIITQVMLTGVLIRHVDISICLDHKLRQPYGVKKYFKFRSTASSLFVWC